MQKETMYKKIQLCEKCNGDNIFTQCKIKSIYDSSKNICLCQNGYLFDHVKDQCISNKIVKKLEKVAPKLIKLCEKYSKDNKILY